MLQREVRATTSTRKTVLHLLTFNHRTVNFLLRQANCATRTDTAETTSVNVCCQALKINLAKKKNPPGSFFIKLSNSQK